MKSDRLGCPDVGDAIRASLRSGSGLALKEGSDALDWRELANRIEAIDEGLRNAGIGPGGVVAVSGRNDLNCAVTVLALLATGRGAGIINPFQQPVARMAAARSYRPDAILLPEGDTALESIGRDDAVLVLTPHGEVRSLSGSIGAFSRQRRETSLIISTSGTTGTPKPVLLSRSTLSRAMHEIAAINAGFGDRRQVDGSWPPLIQYSPLAHAGGALTLVRAAVQGRPVIILDKFDPVKWSDIVETFKLYTTGLPPTMMRMVLDADIPAASIASLVSVWSGSAPIRARDCDAFTDRYGLPILGNYGATEFCGAIAAWSLADYRAHYPHRRQAVGRLDPDVAMVRIRGADGALLEEPGAIGALEFRVHRVGGGWIATNDLGHVDHEGFLTLQGRADDAIIRGGFKLAPDKIADVLREHPAVLEAVVIGLADERLGQVPVAAVEIAEDARVEQAELCEFVKQRLPAYFAPVAVRTMRRLPRTATMKLDRRAIAALFR